MSGDYADWLIEHFHRYKKRDALGLHDSAFMALYRRRLSTEAKVQGCGEDELLVVIEECLLDPDAVAGGD